MWHQAGSGREPRRLKRRVSDMATFVRPPNMEERLTDYNRETTTLELGRSEAVQWDSDRFHMDGVVT
jgi:hypothetical protein